MILSASPDDRDFETIYRSIPVGLTVVAAKLDHFETFRAFCFSLKGAAIRLGSNAMLFPWQYSKRNWLTRGMQHLSSFVEKHKANGVRLFLIDQPTGWADREVAILIREVAEAADVCIILTSFAGPTTKGAMKRAAILDGGVIEFFAQSAIALQCRSTKRIVRSEMAFPIGETIRMSGGPAGRKSRLYVIWPNGPVRKARANWRRRRWPGSICRIDPQSWQAGRNASAG